ncbi:MFS transporter [Pauljensenia sp. UMB1235]|uniref:MFS transporter n=1 Tax=unclassified Pauljensenia TaxID=2908895 RepID=UPI00254A777B|nr:MULTISPECIES: MFS transporter [unclassified Pauljensenia]MDK6400937.1 MFS transporter [Pauljensenia sp. UMB9872]MDK7173492.1 MFS transporter [Pauljensenia sp. UMB1235]
MSRTFHSLRYFNFRLWFFGNIIASTGMWMQRVAQDWLVLTVLTQNSGTQVGVVTALQFLPILVLSPWAGLLADRLNRRALLQAMQLAHALLGLILGVLILTNTAQLWHVYVLALLGGVAGAIDSPARQAFVSELVPPVSLSNAVGLNSTAFNAARLIGPAVSGLLIDAIGTGWVMIVTAVAFFAPVLTLALMRSADLVPRKVVKRSPGQIREGVSYVKSRPDIVLILVIVAVVSGLGMNFQLTSALMATEVYGKAAGEYGILGSFMAVGALGGSLLAARRAQPRLRLIVSGAAIYGLLEIVLALAPTYESFAVLAIPTGLAMLTMVTAANATIQITTDETVRGRVMALYSMIFLGATPIGSPFIGWVGEQFGARWSILVGGGASLAVGVIAGVWGLIHWNYRVKFHVSAHPIKVEGPAERAYVAALVAEAERNATGK